ncbi:UNVERIFIED_CONTAM: polyprotein [Sesamum radiatum]|uniref:Polyprotein n=1 Tax=Sesamum radiatum TaxID=300843 RepID=A0AAW2J2R9_SESRA
MADAESSRRPQEQGDENVEESDSDPETTEPTVTQPDVSTSNQLLARGSLLMMSRLLNEEKGSTPFQHGLIFNLPEKVRLSLKYLKNLLLDLQDDSSEEEDEHSTVEEEDYTQPYLPIYMMQASSTLEVSIPAPQRLQVLPTGLKYKRYFQPFSTIPRIFAIADAPAPYTDIANQLKQCCADSHADFKHPHPLWKNPEFFIQLPFKLNEDANPIKASHPGMTPDDLALAREECSQLLALGLIEPTKSNWACPAFYVNKRTEQIRGKKRLVIDYKALNHFLLDDKFPLPKTRRESNSEGDSAIPWYSKLYQGLHPSVLSYTSQLSKLLKKEPPPWGQAQTMALQKLKQVCQQPLPLKIPSTGHRILQTDASNEFWGAILIEEENGKKHFCGHASGQFKDSEKHYHAVYKEILAIKPSGIHLISPAGTIPIFMASSSSSTSRSPLTFPPKFFHDLKNIREYALDHMFLYLARLLRRQIYHKVEDASDQIILSSPSSLYQDQVHYLKMDCGIYGASQHYTISYRSQPWTDDRTSPRHQNGKSLVWVFLSWFDDVKDWLRQFPTTSSGRKELHIIILHRPYYAAQRPRLVYTSLVIEPMDEDSDSDSIPEPDSQDPWDYGTEINLESPAASFHHGRPSTSA